MNDIPGVEQLIDQFEESWRSGHPPSLAEAVASIDSLSPDAQRQLLNELVAVDLEYRWRGGFHTVSTESPDQDTLPERPRIEDYQYWLDGISAEHPIHLSLVEEEYRVRHLFGDKPEHEEFIQRFGEHHDQLSERLSEIDMQIIRELPAGEIESCRIDASVTETVAHPRNVGATPALPLGERFGRYKVISLLGQGGMGEVYRAYDTQLEREVALKIPKFVGDDSEMLTRFFREARLAAVLRHSNICTVYDVSEIAGTHFISMALIDGKSLESVLSERGSLPENEVVNFAIKIASALEVAHSAGIVHRDLKPANVMVDDTGEPVLTDFGLARQEDNGGTLQTQEGAVLGTPAYMSPEQVEGRIDEIGPTTDIYSLGVMLYRLTSGKLPFVGSMSKVMVDILTSEPAQLSDHNPEVSQAFAELVHHMMSKDANLRHASMTAVIDDLQRLQSGKYEVQACPAANPNDRESRRYWRRHVAIAGGLLGVLTLLAALVFYISTPTGIVEIRADDSVSVTIRRNGQAVDSLELTRGTKKTTVRTGTIAIEVSGSEADRFIVKQSQLQLSRNGVVVFEVLVAKKPARSPVDMHAEQPLRVATKRPEISPREAIQWVYDIGGKIGVHHESPKFPEAADVPIDGSKKLNVSLESISELCDDDLTKLQCIPNVSIVGISFTSIGDKGFEHLSKIATLEGIYAQKTNVTDVGLEHLVALEHLHYLSVSITKVTRKGLQGLGRHSDLTDLHMAWLNVDDKTLLSLQHLPIKSLYVKGGIVSVVGIMQFIKTRREMHTLAIGGMPVGDEFVQTLTRFPRMWRLSMPETQITDACVDDLLKLKNLEELNVEKTSLTPATIERLKAGLPNLKELKH